MRIVEGVHVSRTRRIGSRSETVGLRLSQNAIGRRLDRRKDSRVAIRAITACLMGQDLLVDQCFERLKAHPGVG